LLGLAAALGLLAAACGGSNLDVPGELPTATPTQTTAPTNTPTAKPAAGGVTGLVVLHQNFAYDAPEALGVPPAGWADPADTAAFDRALASADWTVDGIPEQRGVTGPDGTFTIGELPPGRYTLQVSKTIDGNLVPLAVPFAVGDDGAAEVIVEVGLGLVRTTITYTQDGVRIQEIRGPWNWLITRDGRISELGDYSRVLTDSDGDGQFDGGPCTDGLADCGEDRVCADGQLCECTASCPFCEDCGPAICAPKGVSPPYRCAVDDTCVRPGDRCVCVSSCPACDDCVRKVCVSGCDSVAITAITAAGPAQLIVGRQAQMYATAQLSDGTVFDVTYLADWRSSNEAVATVDSWGTVWGSETAGVTHLTASLGAMSSAPWALAVVERPTLLRIFLQNQSCYCGPTILGGLDMGVAVRPCILDASWRTDILPVPSCGQVVQVGATLRFAAIGEFGDGSYEDITDEVDWEVVPAEVGDVVGGLFTARQAGTARLTASLGEVTGEPTDVRVVTEPTVDSLSIYPSNVGFAVIDGGPVIGDAVAPCFDCGAAVTVLRGDELRFQATAHYDTGEWRDVTDSVTWRSSDASVATIDSAGTMTAVQGGDTVIDAMLGEVASNPVSVRVVNEATLQSIYIYQEGGDRVVAKGDQRFFHATGYYDVNISRDVTAEATWHSSDGSLGRFDAPGAFTALAAGTVQVWAELGGQKSPPLALEVFETSELAYCDPLNINRAMWSDDFNRVVLESDCAEYSQPGVVTLRYTVTETQPHGGIFDPCLDLYVYEGGTRVRTIREEGCGDPFLASAAPGRDEAVVKYQLRAFWDMKDDAGNAVQPGTYTVYGRFYLYYDPVVSIDVAVLTPSGTRPTPAATSTPTPLPGGVVIQVGSATGAAGEQVSVDVSMESGGARVAGVQNDIISGTWLRIGAAASGRPDCKVNPAINKTSTAFSFLPAGCRPGVNCDGVRAIVYSLDNFDPIPDGAVLYTCAVAIPEDAAPGGYALRCADPVASDANGRRITAGCGDGGVRVTGAMPTPAVAITTGRRGLRPS
jgi:hypothetical protein